MPAKKKSEAKKEKKDPKKEDLLIENFITLQKVLTNLAVRVDALTDQTSKLLSLFEISAKSLAQKHGSVLSRDDKDFLQKLDQLIEQNKLIAKGISIMDDKHQQSIPRPSINREDIKPHPLPRRI